MSNPPSFQAGDSLLLVDPQNDFCPGGSLAVANGDQVMPVLSVWAAAAERANIPIVVTRDWHPPKTTHFKEYGGVWPPHCVMRTHGAEFHPDLEIPASALVVSKGMGEAEDAYSAFQARDDSGTPLQTLLERRERRMVTHINHCLSKEVVALAQRCHAGIHLEDLSGIRQRSRQRWLHT